jgi:RNA polymerase sigma factor (sigma-70 family)
MLTSQSSYEAYLREISVYPRIDVQREIKLSHIIQNSADSNEVDRAIEELIHANLRLVVHCLKDFDKRLSSPSARITRMDLIAEGNIGLMKAAQRFDAGHVDEEGKRKSAIRFSTYACKCIKNRMRRALKLARFIHIPEHHFGYWSKMDTLYGDFGADISDEEMRRKLDVSEDVMGLLKQSSGSRTCMLEDLACHEGEGSGWHDFIANESASCPADEADLRDLRTFLFNEMGKLPPRTQNMLSMMYFSEHKNITLKDLAHKYGISSERCRQVCAQGIERLRRQMLGRIKLIDPARSQQEAFAA